MADLPETATYAAGIYQLEKTDINEAGPNGILNEQAKQLANRTAWLKSQVEAAAAVFPDLLTDHTHLAALFGQLVREAARIDAERQRLEGDVSPLHLLTALGALAPAVAQIARQTNGGRITLAGGSLDDPAIRIGSAGIYRAAADTLSVAIAGVERLRITATGITVYGTVTTVP